MGYSKQRRILAWVTAAHSSKLFFCFVFVKPSIKDTWGGLHPADDVDRRTHTIVSVLCWINIKQFVF